MASKLRRVRKYQRVTGKRLGKHWWRKRMQTSTGRRVLAKRRAKGRRELVAQRPAKKSIRW